MAKVVETGAVEGQGRAQCADQGAAFARNRLPRLASEILVQGLPGEERHHHRQTAHHG